MTLGYGYLTTPVDDYDHDFKVGLKNLREHISHCLKIVEKGGKLIVLNRKKEIGQITSVGRMADTSLEWFPTREARQRLTQIFEQVKEGKKFIFTRAGKPIALVGPVEK